MEIIMLSGKNSSGKTTTLNLLHKVVLSKNGKSTCKKQLGGNKYDFSDVVQFNNKTIGFFTMGDYSLEVCNAIKKYDNLKIDILICACNSRFIKPFQLIKNYTYKIINKTLASNKSDEIGSNQKDMDLIMDLI